MKAKNDIYELQHNVGYKVNTTGLIKQSIALSSELDMLQPYATLADDMLWLNYGGFRLKSAISTDVALLYTCNALLSEKYNLQTLIGTLNLKYDPIENYSMVEDGTDNRTLNYAARETNSQLESSEKTDTVNINSAQKQSTVKMENVAHVTDTVNTHAVTPFNTTTLTNTEQDITKATQQAHTDTNTTTQNPYNDTTTNTQSPYTDKSKLTENARIDTDNNVHHLTRKGNIGTLTSQAMIESERSLANVNIPELICKIVVKNICKGVQLTL